MNNIGVDHYLGLKIATGFCVSVLFLSTQHRTKKSWGGKNKTAAKNLRCAGNTRRFNCPWCHGRYQWSWKPYIELKNCWRMNCQKATSPLEKRLEKMKGEVEVGWEPKSASQDAEVFKLPAKFQDFQVEWSSFIFSGENCGFNTIETFPSRW